MSCKKIIYWLPRILAIVFILFLALFALDVFEEGYKFGELLVALFMHLVPNFVFLTLLIIAWKREKLGGYLFILISIVFTLFFKTYREIFTFLLISGPPLLIGLLFLASFISSSKISLRAGKNKI